MSDEVSDRETVREVWRLSDRRTEMRCGGNQMTDLVIADSGDMAELLAVASRERVRSGVRFQYRGGWWVVTGRHRDSGVAVAEPVRN